MGDYKKYQKILVPLDGSKLSESVLPEVERLASALGAIILILRVVNVHFWLGTDPLVQEAKEVKVVEKAQEYVDKIKEQMENRGFTAESCVAYGPDAAKQILNFASAYHNIDFIMMCTHGYTGAKHLLFGSVAEKVVHHTTIPVFLVRAK